MNAVIEVDGLTKWYGARRGIDGVSFAIHQGEVFGFLGPNGAGKTTTLRILMGMIRPTAGTARVMGRDAWLDAPAIHRSVAFLPSEPGFLGELSAARQLDVIARLRGLAAGAWQPMAARLGLDPSVPIRQLSRGNRQKVGVVCAFMGHEPLLLLDEPTSGLDPLLQREFLAIVAEARAAGRTILLSSHNLPEVERASDRVAIIRDGRIVEISTVGDLRRVHWRAVTLVLDRPPEPGTFDLPGVRVEAAQGHDVHLLVQGDPNPLLRRLATLAVHDVSIATPDIEDVFLRYYDGADGSAPPGVAEAPGPPPGRIDRPTAEPAGPIEAPSEPAEPIEAPSEPIEPPVAAATGRSGR